MNGNIVFLLYMMRGDELYILMRFCFFNALYYSMFCMAHHCLEFYFKAGLVNYISIPEIKRLGHNLKNLYRKYKQYTKNLSIDEKIIQYLDGFASFKYPEINKHIIWGSESSYKNFFKSLPNGYEKHIACFSLPDIDKIVFNLRSSLPEGDKLPFITITKDVEYYLYKDNKYFSKEENDRR